MEFVLTIHGFMRWLVAIVALAAIIKFTLGLIRKEAYTGLDRGLMAAFTGLLDLNLLFGLILLFGLGGGFPRHRIEHAGTMIIAIIIAHSAAAWKKSDNSAKKYRNNLIVVVVALAFVFLGVIQVRGGFF